MKARFNTKTQGRKVFYSPFTIRHPPLMCGKAFMGCGWSGADEHTRLLVMASAVGRTAKAVTTNKFVIY